MYVTPKDAIYKILLCKAFGDSDLIFDLTCDSRLTTIGRSRLVGALVGVSVTSAARHLVLIAFELITPVSVKQCCQTSPAQPMLSLYPLHPCWPNGGIIGG